MLTRSFYLTLAVACAGLSLAHPGGYGTPRLMGRRGIIDIRDLPEFGAANNLFKRAVESPDGTCGGTNRYVCGNSLNRCCSQYGYCGDSTAHCGDGCQAGFGLCGSDLPPPVSEPDGGECGAKNGGKKCADGLCCSEDGYCEDTKDACMAPYCQQGFGKCDADYNPSGGSTENVARPNIGPVPYDEIYDCINPGEVALTFDDGPDIYTDNLLTILQRYSAKATFFLTGINNGKGPIDTTATWSSVIRKMHSQGHQLASHTWSHRDLSLLSETQRREEIIKLEMALRNIVGFFPTYLRPPYSSCNAACAATLKALGYHTVYFNLDTDDYNNATPDLIQNSKNRFSEAVVGSNPRTDQFLVISHDIQQQTVQNLTAFMLDTLKSRGYKAVTLGDCLGDPKVNWYRTPGAPVPASTTQRPTSVNPTRTVTVTRSRTTSSRRTTTVTRQTNNPGQPTRTVIISPTRPATNPNCPLRVGSFCAKPLQSWNNVQGCQSAAQACLQDAAACSLQVSSASQKAKCQEYLQMCAGVAGYCSQQCSGGARQSCPFVQIQFPSSL